MSTEEEQTELKMEAEELNSSDRLESVENPTNNKSEGVGSKEEAGSSVGPLNELTIPAKKTFCCDECGKIFRWASSLKYHQRVHSGERPYSCDECGKSFKFSSHLKLHQRVHSGERPYSCDECGMSSKSSSDLKKHQLIHSGEKPYRCHLCQQSFRLRGQLISHEKTFKHYKKSLGL